MSDQVLYYVGFALYTFDDIQPKAALSLLSRLQSICPGSKIANLSFRSVDDAADGRRPHRVSLQQLDEQLGQRRIHDFLALDGSNSRNSQIRMHVALRSLAPHPNSLTLRVPLGAFEKDPSGASTRLLQFAIRAFAELHASYGYAGLRVTATESNLVNKIINESMGSIPIGDFFDLNIESEFRDRIKGAFWANFLNANHVNQLGGESIVRQSAPCERIAPLADGGLLLQLKVDPLIRDREQEEVLYRRLRDYLSPITNGTVPNVPSSLQATGRVYRHTYNV
jgi:hypothetical protein